MAPEEDLDDLPFTNGRDHLVPWKVFERFSKGVLQSNWLDIETSIAWSYGLRLTGVSIKKRPDGWRMMIQAVGNGGNKVSFTTTERFSECLELGAWEALAAMMTWHEDKYPVSD